MALSNPRFRYNTQLKSAATNSPALKKGSKGQGVHVLQFALLDLGYKLPKSTGGANFSPDGDFGSETEAAVQDFQRKNQLKDDGVVGANTMAKFDAVVPGVTHKVRLHFRSISLTDVSFDALFRKARDCYDQYGILLEMASGMSLAITPEQTALFSKIDQECKWNLTDGEYGELHKLGPHAPGYDVKVYFVNDMLGVVGCGGHAPGKPTATVAKAAGAVDLGHEVGHVLLGQNFVPVHHTHAQNIMSATGRNEGWTWVFNEAQITQIRKHPCCHAA